MYGCKSFPFLVSVNPSYYVHTCMYSSVCISRSSPFIFQSIKFWILNICHPNCKKFHHLHHPVNRYLQYQLSSIPPTALTELPHQSSFSPTTVRSSLYPFKIFPFTCSFVLYLPTYIYIIYLAVSAVSVLLCRKYYFF